MEWDIIINVLQGLPTLIIGVTVAYIAWQQYKTNRNTFRLGLYDRKLKVFEGLTTLLEHIERQNTVLFEQLQQYRRATIEAIFLFDDEDILNYLQEVKHKVHKLQFVNRRIDKNLPDNRQTEVLKEQTELLDWFNLQLPESVNKFKKALRFE